MFVFGAGVWSLYHAVSKQENFASQQVVVRVSYHGGPAYFGHAVAWLLTGTIGGQMLL